MQALQCTGKRWCLLPCATLILPNLGQELPASAALPDGHRLVSWLAGLPNSPHAAEVPALVRSIDLDHWTAWCLYTDARRPRLPLRVQHSVIAFADWGRHYGLSFPI